MASHLESLVAPVHYKKIWHQHSKQIPCCFPFPKFFGRVKTMPLSSVKVHFSMWMHSLIVLIHVGYWVYSSTCSHRSNWHLLKNDRSFYQEEREELTRRYNCSFIKNILGAKNVLHTQYGGLVCPSLSTHEGVANNARYKKTNLNSNFKHILLYTKSSSITANGFHSPRRRVSLWKSKYFKNTQFTERCQWEKWWKKTKYFLDNRKTTPLSRESTTLTLN